MKHTIDAKGRTVGRVASEVAVLLMDKHLPQFARNKAGTTRVEIVNASSLSIAPGKMLQKRYKRYSGYPGGLTEESIPQVVAKKGYGELLRHAIYGMLPSNKLRGERMKHLTITE